MKGLGIRGAGLIPPSLQGASLGMPPWDFDPNLVTFTAGMAKRATSVFAAAPIIQGKVDGTGLGDVLIASKGVLIAGSYFYSNIDINQGSINLRITPEWNGNDGIQHHFIYTNWSQLHLYKHDSGNLYFFTPSVGSVIVDISGWVAGTTYNVCIRWDCKNTLDGTNYACISINDVHTFGSTGGGYVVSGNLYIGQGSGASNSANAIIEGLTIYRRVLYDGTYGVNVGNGDEVNLISAGVDPCTITGSWDVCFALPTDSTPGALVTG